MPGTNFFAILNNNVKVSRTNENNKAIEIECDGNPNVYATEGEIYENGCLARRTDISSGDNLYQNVGSLSVPTWEALGGGSTGVTSLNSLTGDVNLVEGDNVSFDIAGNDITINALANGVTSVNGQTGDVDLTTTDIPEGDNLYWTQDRFDTAFDIDLASKTTDDLAEGSLNKYYTGVTHDATMTGAGTVSDPLSAVAQLPNFTPGSVPYADVDGTLTEDNSNFFFDDSIIELKLGDASILDGVPGNIINAAGNYPDSYIAISAHNSADSGSTDMVVSANNDDGTILTGVYGDFGIAGSDYTTIGDPFNKSGDVYLLSSFGAGDLNIGAQGPGKKIQFATSNDDLDSIRVVISDSQTTLSANKDIELAPALEAVDWTATGGWSAGSGELELITDAGISTIEPSASSWVVAGVTYRVVIEVSAVSGDVTYTLGDVDGSPLFVGTVIDYITADNTDKLIFSGAIGATATITSLSVRALVDDTGDLFVEGNIIMGSQLRTIGGNGIMNIAGDGTAAFPKFPMLPNAYPVDGQEAANKAYVDNFVTSGTRFVGNVRAATTAALPANLYNNGASGVGATLTGLLNGALPDQDGVTLVDDDILMVKNEADPTTNGVYKLVQGTVGTPYVLTRVSNYNVTVEIVTGTFFTILEGTTQSLQQWAMVTNDTIIVGTTDIVFAQLSEPITYTASDGVQLIGTDFSAKIQTTGGIGLGGFASDELKVNVDNSSIEIGTNLVRVKDGGVTFAKMQDISSGVLLGRSTALPGSPEEITLGTGLSLAGGVLDASSTSPITVANTTTLYSSGLSGTGAGNATGYNFIAGVSAGSGASNVDHGVFIGLSAGAGATNANNSIFLGQQAGFVASGAFDAIMIGNGAGFNATSAISSIIMGRDAGSGATNADGSVFLGNGAGNNASSASHAVAIGVNAGGAATNGDNSIYLGEAAGQNATNSYDTIFIGTNAGKNDFVNNAFGSSSIAIGSGAGTGGFSNSIALGAGAVNSATHQLLVAPAYTQFNMRGVNYTMPTSNIAGVLNNDGSGNLSWGAATSNFQLLRNSANFTRTSTTVLANVTGLAATLATGTYQFEAQLYTTSGNAGGVKAAMTFSGTSSALLYQGTTVNSTTLTTSRGAASAAVVGAVTNVTAATITITGTIIVTVSGILRVQFGQNASNATASVVLANSTLRVWKQ